MCFFTSTIWQSVEVMADWFSVTLHWTCWFLSKQRNRFIRWFSSLASVNFQVHIFLGKPNQNMKWRFKRHISNNDLICLKSSSIKSNNSVSVYGCVSWCFTYCKSFSHKVDNWVTVGPLTLYFVENVGFLNSIIGSVSLTPYHIFCPHRRWKQFQKHPATELNQHLSDRNFKLFFKIIIFKTVQLIAELLSCWPGWRSLVQSPDRNDKIR